MRRSIVIGWMGALLAVCAPAQAAQPPIRHVFTIVLENKTYDETFGANSQAPYLARTLAAKGALLTQYYGTGHESLDNYLTMISGQAPNPETQADCQYYRDVTPGTILTDGQAFGTGCVYPAGVKTIGDQLEAKGLTWKGYMEDMGADPAREPATCGHPKLNAQDNAQKATATDQYATRHNPFVYFHSIIDDQKRCDARDVPLTQLPGDLASAATTPNYVFITPDLCHDGHDTPCADGTPGGYKGIDDFLAAWVPKILASPAFQQDGLLIVTFDEADGEEVSEACCNEPTGLSTPMPGITGPGGGRVGAVLISPFVSAGSKVDEPFNHYSYLRSVEDLFGLERLGYAGQDGLKTFQDAGVLHEAPASLGAAPAASCAGTRLIRETSVQGKGSSLRVLVPVLATATLDADIVRFDARGRRHVLQRYRARDSSFTYDIGRSGLYGLELRAHGTAARRSLALRRTAKGLRAVATYGFGADCGPVREATLAGPVFRGPLRLRAHVTRPSKLLVWRGRKALVRRTIRGSRRVTVPVRARGGYRVRLGGVTLAAARL